MSTNIVQLALNALAQVRYLHWMTTSYVIHKELGNLYERLDELIDRFVESYLGTNRANRDIPSIFIEPATQQKPYSAILNEIKMKFRTAGSNLDSALQNIVDEITGSIDQTLYLIAMT